MRVLLIEDDEYIAKFLETVLVKENYAVDVATDGELGWRLIETFTYDLILLDVILPKLDGITLCRQIREHHYQTPILLLTARDSSSDRVSGLDAGADDYMVKPFELPELFARMRVLLRRSSSPMMPVLTWEQLQLDPTACQVTYADRPLHLTPKEYRLLELFLRNPRYVFTRSRILEHLWGAEEAPAEDTITAHIKGLRQKLKQAGAPAGFIETVYGIGYRLKQNSSDKATIDAAGPTSQPLRDRPIANSSAAPPFHPFGYPQSMPVELEQSWHKQRIHTALQAVWQKYEPQNRDRLQILEQTIAAMQADNMWDELWQQAQSAAHKLAGALGVFQRSQGSQLALQLEQFFRAKQMPDPQELEFLMELTNTLKAILLEVPPTDTPLSPISADLPELVLTRASLLLILDDAAEQVTEIIRATQNPIVPMLNLSFAYRALAEGIQHRPNKPASLQPHAASLAQRFILDLSLTDLAESDLALLKEITHQVPPVFVLVFTDRADLTLRAKLAQAGVDAVLPQLLPEQVLSLVEKLQLPTPEAPKQILIVDDDPQLLAAMRAILEPWGLHLIALERSPQLWETLQAHAPDLLILDVEMPDLNGIELCQAVRSVPGWKHLPIWFLTAHTDANTLYQAINAGANALIGKPIRESEIIRRILGEFQRSQLSQVLLS
ncbi:response regulator [Phormidium tenue FACHB-886]|nr:response regulator [Phormidium tenue FACHB-886]